MRTDSQVLPSFVLEEIQPLKTRRVRNYLYRALSLAISGSKENYIKLKTLDYSFRLSFLLCLKCGHSLLGKQKDY